MPTLEMEPVVDRVKGAVRDAKLPELDVDVQAIAEDIRAGMTKNSKKLDKQAKRAAKAMREELAKVDADALPLPKAAREAVKEQLPKQKGGGFGRVLLLLGVLGLAAGLVPEVRRRVRMAAQTVYGMVNDLLQRPQRTDPVAFPAAEAIQVNGDPWAQDSLSPLPEGLGAAQEERLAPGSDRTDYADAVR